MDQISTAQSILTVSGSSAPGSSNGRLLQVVAEHFTDYNFLKSPEIVELPLFRVSMDHAPWTAKVLEWRRAILQSRAVIISTPAYLHNVPAVLKNALEWLTTSGELDGKPVLAVTYTPHPPRGEEAMQSLLWSLKALNARIVAQCPLYQSELSITERGELQGDDAIEHITEALKML